MGKDEKTEFRKFELLYDFLQETYVLIKIFVASIKIPEKNLEMVIQSSTLVFHSILEVRCSMLDVHLLKQPCTA